MYAEYLEHVKKTFLLAVIEARPQTTVRHIDAESQCICAHVFRRAMNFAHIRAKEALKNNKNKK